MKNDGVLTKLDKATYGPVSHSKTECERRLDLLISIDVFHLLFTFNVI